MYISILLLLLSAPVLCHATTITFTSSGTIQDEDVYNYVYVENDGTVVDMAGGQIGNLGTSYISTFNLFGGQIKKVELTDPASSIYNGPLSTINILNGLVDIENFNVEGIANISGGNISSTTLKTYSDSIIEINGGVLDFNSVNIMGELNIYRGLLNIKDSWGTFGVVNIYGYGFNYVPIGDPFWGGGTLTGYLLDNNPFTIDGLSQDEFENFNLIPEPATLLLFGLGGLLLRKRR